MNIDSIKFKFCGLTNEHVNLCSTYNKTRTFGQNMQNLIHKIQNVVFI